MNLILGLIGVLILVSGRRLFWLFVGCAGFVAGLQAGQYYFGWQPVWAAWAAAILLGFTGALLALFFQTLAIGLGGFAAGSAVAAYLAALFNIKAMALISLTGGIIGAVLLYAAFDWALIVLSSVAGATLVVQAMDWNPRTEMILYAVLAAAGVLIQATLLRKRRPYIKQRRHIR